MNWIKTEEGVIIRADLLERFELRSQGKEVVIHGIFQEVIEQRQKERFKMGGSFKSFEQAEEAIERFIRAIDEDGGSIHRIRQDDE